MSFLSLQTLEFRKAPQKEVRMNAEGQQMMPNSSPRLKGLEEASEEKIGELSLITRLKDLVVRTDPPGQRPTSQSSAFTWLFTLLS